MTGDCAYRSGGKGCFWHARNCYRGKLYCDTHILTVQVEAVQANAAEYLRQHGEQVEHVEPKCRGCADA